MRYKNISGATLTFYGVTFNPGDVKDVPGPINAPQLISTTEEITQPAAIIAVDTAKSAPAEPVIVVDAPKREAKTTTQKKKEANSDGKDNNQ